MKITQRYLTTSGVKFDVIKIENKYDINKEELGNIILSLREQKNGFDKIKKILKKDYNIEKSVYKIKKIYKDLIK